MMPKCLRPWWPHFEAAGDKYGVDPYLLAAICLRESHGGKALTPPGPEGTGDNGNGLGLMQVDKRFHRAFYESGSWKDAGANILYGASVLAEALKTLKDEHLACAAYNAGVRAVRAAIDDITDPDDGRGMLSIQREAADMCTTGHDYGEWVLARRDSFRLKPKE